MFRYITALRPSCVSVTKRFMHQTPRPLNVLVIDGYTREGRQNLVDHQVPLAGDLYAKMLLATSPVPMQVTKYYPCDDEDTVNPADIDIPGTGKLNIPIHLQPLSANAPIRPPKPELTLGWTTTPFTSIDKSAFSSVADADGPLYAAKKPWSTPQCEDEEWIQNRLPPPVTKLIGSSDLASVITMPPEQLIASLAYFDAVAWTGCSLGVTSGEPKVDKQLAVARAAYALGIPQFGSCWAAQIAVYALGGKVGSCARGREMGLARVDLTPAGLRHGLFSSLPANFDVSESHDDEVHAEPPRNAAVDSQVLAGNRHSMVQAIDVRAGPGRFWAIQWHPEYSLADLAALTHARADKLVSQGFYTDRAQVMRRTRAFYELDAEPGRKDLETRLGLRSEGMGEAARYALCGNWVRKQVVPFYAKRLHGVAQGVEEGERLKESRG